MIKFLSEFKDFISVKIDISPIQLLLNYKIYKKSLINFNKLFLNRMIYFKLLKL